MAITNFSKSIEVSPDYALPYYNRALTFEHLGKNQEAIADYKQYISIDTMKSYTNDAKNRLSRLLGSDDYF